MPSPNTLVLARLSGINSAVALKAPVRAAAITPITLAGFQTIDGVQFLATDQANLLNTRVLVMGQTDQTTNGIYIVSAGTWSRAPDFDGNDDAVQGTRVQVVQGTVSQGVYTLATSDPVLLTNTGLGVSNIVFVFQVSSQLINLAVGTTTAVNGVTAAIAVAGNVNTILTTRYYANDGDGGGGTFFWSTANHATDVANDPGRGIFIPSFGDLSGATGAWVRQYSGPVNIRWFGATGNGVTADDGPFMYFNIWARAQTTSAVSLLIPPGTYHFSNASSPQSFGAGADLVTTSQWLYGIKKVRVSGYGATTDGLFLGGAGPFQDNLHYGLTNAISQGATSITLSNSSDATKFSTNTWAILGQIDTQGFGYPQNFGIFEYVYITNISGGTITVRDAIKHNYLTTFPNYSAGDSGHANLGGPATLFAMATAWDSDIEISGMTFTGSEVFGGMRKVHFIDCDLSAVGNHSPSNSQFYTVERCNLTSTLMEVDKIVAQMTFIDCQCANSGSIQIVSASVEYVDILRCKLGGGLLGGGKYLRIEQSTVGQLIYGTSFGQLETLTISDSEILVLTPAVNATPHALSSFSFANGVFSIATGSGPVTDALPGAVFFFYDTNAATDNLGFPFRVLDVTASGGNTHIATTLQSLPTLSDLSNNPVSHFTRHPCTRLTVRNCTGHQDIVNLSKAQAYGLPPYSYAECTVITGTTTSFPSMIMWGQLVSLTINVIRAYTGAQSTLTLDPGGQFGVFVVNSSGNVVHNAFSSQVNLKIAGIRTITPAGVTGAQSGDNITSPGANNAWLVFGISGGFVSAATNADRLDQQAIVQIQCQTDQGAICTIPLLFNGTSGPIPLLPA